MKEPTLVEIPTFKNDLGELSVVEDSNVFPFEIRRVYFLHSVPKGSVRGSHAHKKLDQLIVASSGSFAVRLDSGKKVFEFCLSTPTVGLLVPPGYWRTLSDFSSEATAMVLASQKYDESDYIRNYEAFLEWKLIDSGTFL